MSDGQVLGFIGLGVMGEPICRNMMQKSGARMLVSDLSDGPVDRLTALGAEAATAEQIAQVTRQYGAGFRRQEEGETSYIIDHTSRTYLIDREGVVRYLFSSEDAAELMAAVIEQVP